MKFFLPVVLAALGCAPVLAMDGEKKVTQSKQEELNRELYECFTPKFYSNNPTEHHLDAAANLLARGADINGQQDCYHGFQTPVEVAVSLVDQVSVPWLLERGADDTVNQGQFYDWLENAPHQKPIIARYYQKKVLPEIAAALHFPKALIDLIVSKLYISQADVDLFNTVETSTLEELSHLLVHKKADPNILHKTPVRGFHTPLLGAIRAEGTERLKLLLEHGACPNTWWMSNNYGAPGPRRALNYLAEFYDGGPRKNATLEKLRLLLMHKADPSLGDSLSANNYGLREWWFNFFDHAWCIEDLMKVYLECAQKIPELRNQYVKQVLAHNVDFKHAPLPHGKIRDVSAIIESYCDNS